MKCHYFISGESNLPAVELAPNFPYLPVNGLSREQISHRLLDLKDQTEVIDRSFCTLVLNLKKDIEKSCTLEDVITLLILKYDLEKLLSDCKNLTEVFRKIKKYFSFFDFGLIKLLAHNFGSSTFKKKLKKYKKKFQNYSKRRVCECPGDAFGSAEDSEKVYNIKTEEDFKTLTVEQLEKLEYEMNKILGHKLLRLLSINEGCVELTFRVSLEDELTVTEEQQQALRKLNILCISFGDTIVEISSPAASNSTEATRMNISGKHNIF